MTIDATIAKPRFDIGRVIARMFSVIRGNPAVFLGLTLVLTLPTTLYAYVQYALFVPRVNYGTTAEQWSQMGVYLGGLAVYLLSLSLLQAALCQATIVTLNGERASFAGCLATGLRNAIPVTLITIMWAIGIVLGASLLLVPGIVLSLMWFVVTPVRVIESTDVMETFRRSAALTGGYRGHLFGLLVIFLVVWLGLRLGAPGLLGRMLYGAGHGEIMIVAFGADALITVITTLIAATGVASTYYELRTVKEGIVPEQLAAVFS
jgi:hypothetical protein